MDGNNDKDTTGRQSERLGSEEIRLLKTATGIEHANCESCDYLWEEGGGWDECRAYPVCRRIEQYSCLKSFPFKKDMPCWWPNFWCSKFVDSVEGLDSSFDAAHERFDLAVKSVFPNTQGQPRREEN